MSAEENKAIVRRFFAALQRHDPAAAAALMSREVVAHFAGLPTAVQGLEAWQLLFGSYAAAFPDMQISISDEVAEGDKAVVRYSWTATHQADFMGIPASHRRVSELAGLGVYHIAEGLIAEEWVVRGHTGIAATDRGGAGTRPAGERSGVEAAVCAASCWVSPK